MTGGETSRSILAWTLAAKLLGLILPGSCFFEEIIRDRLRRRHLSRLQFAITALYHFLFVPLTLVFVHDPRHHGVRLRS